MVSYNDTNTWIRSTDIKILEVKKPIRISDEKREVCAHVREALCGGSRCVGWDEGEG